MSFEIDSFIQAMLLVRADIFEFQIDLWYTMYVEKVVKKINLREESGSNDLDFWAEKSYEERLNALEFLRGQYIAENTQGLQRVFSIIKRS